MPDIKVLTFFSILALALISFKAQAQSVMAPEELTLFYQKEEQRSHFSLGTEVVTLSSKTSELMGFGPRAGFEYGLTDKWSLGANLVFQFQASEKAGAFFYSGITGMIRYAFLGSTHKIMTTVTKKDGTPVFTSRPAANRRLVAIIGMEQLFLNGVSSIYPAVGFTAGVGYGFRLWGQEAEIDARYSSLLANDNPISMLGVGGHINLDF